MYPMEALIWFPESSWVPWLVNQSCRSGLVTLAARPDERRAREVADRDLVGGGIDLADVAAVVGGTTARHQTRR